MIPRQRPVPAPTRSGFLSGLGVSNLYPGLLTALAGRAGFQLKGLAQLGGNLSVPRLQGDQIQLVQFAPFFGK